MKRFKVKRKPERWVSNNRVLLGSSKKDPGRNPNFDTEETKLLISLWGDPVVQKTLITTHRKHTVIAKLADQMNEYGYHRSTEEINTRIKNLKCFYNRLKKDVDTGMVNGVTWKHFSAMDEIMTRSIFSVRPNEIPKPSLKYQMEQELEEKRKRLRSDYTTTINGSDLNQVVDENASCSSLSSKEENNDGQGQSEESMDFGDKTESSYKINGDDCFTAVKTEIEDAPLMIAKEEPIDEDLEIITDEINPNCGNAPILNDYITKVVTPTTSSHFLSTNTVNVNTNSLINTSQIPTTVSQSIVISNPSSNGNPQQGKISLVPTNFLLQKNASPKPKSIQIRPQPPQRIICPKPNTQPNTGIVSTGNNGRMKVLFVNAFQNGTTPNVTAPKEFAISNPNLMTPANQQLPIDSGLTMNYLEQPKQPRPEETEAQIRESSLELLIHKLIESQNENNLIQRQRLELAQERLEFEKSMGNRLLEALISLRPPQSQETENNSDSKNKNTETEELTNEKSIIPEIIGDFDNYHMITPKIEKND